MMNQVYELEGLLQLALTGKQDVQLLGELIVSKSEDIARRAAIIYPLNPKANNFVATDDAIGRDDYEMAEATLDEAEMDADSDDHREMPPHDDPINIADENIVVEEDDEDDMDDMTRIAPVAPKSPELRPKLRRYFPINEIFLFRRELFDGSDVDFNASLRIVEELPRYEDAEDYFISDLQWDAQNPTVISFLSIIKKYYRG